MKRRQRGMFLLQSVAAMAVFSVGVLAVLMLSASAKRQSADVVARMRLGPRDAAVLAKQYGKGGAAALRFADDAALVLPGLAQLPPAIEFGSGGTVVVTLRWQAPGDASSHEYVVATRVAD